jgi:hypothetical protein
MSKLVETKEKDVPSTKVLTGIEGLDQQLTYAELLIKSKLVKFNKPEEVVMVANLGKSLGLTFDVACQNIFSIEGTLGMSVHLMTALAKKGGVDWEITKDGYLIKDDKGVVIDMVTEVTFYRYNPTLKKVFTNVITYHWSDAVKAGYATKPNWKTKPRNMLRARCFTEGIRIVAPDVLMGIPYSVDELLDNTNISYEIDQEGNVKYTNH